jgi:hypothetical protein
MSLLSRPLLCLYAWRPARKRVFTDMPLSKEAKNAVRYTLDLCRRSLMKLIQNAVCTNEFTNRWHPDPSPDGCTLPCPGDKSEACGGPWRASVYEFQVRILTFFMLFYSVLNALYTVFSLLSFLYQGKKFYKVEGGTIWQSTNDRSSEVRNKSSYQYKVRKTLVFKVFMCSMLFALMYLFRKSFSQSKLLFRGGKDSG